MSLLGVSEIPDKIPEHKRRMYSNVQVKVADDVREDKGSPRNCSCLKSCESSYTCPHTPFYRETKGLLHSDNTLELKDYSQCEHTHKCLFTSHIFTRLPLVHTLNLDFLRRQL
jgi:hypothetical protein